MTGSNADCGRTGVHHRTAPRPAPAPAPGALLLALPLASLALAAAGLAERPLPRQQEETREFISREAAAPAAAAEQGPAELPRLIARLDAPEFMQRQEASAAIISDDRITISMIEAALAREDLTPEQRQRLRHIQKHRFESSSRAGMGVKFATQLLPHRVVLDATIPPFRSTEFLQTGDIIESADGIPLRSTRAFDLIRTIILSHDPGEELPIVVRRGEERLELRIPLGRYGDLNNTIALDPSDLERAWRARLARTPDPAREILDPGVPMEDWTKMERDDRERRAARDADATRTGLVAVPPRIIIAGGRPRPPFFDEGEFNKLVVLRNKDELRFEDIQIIREQQAEQQRRIAAVRIAPASPPMSLADEIARVRAVAEQARAEIERLRNEAAAGRHVPPAMLDQHETTLLAADRVLVALLAEQKEAGEPGAPDAP